MSSEDSEDDDRDAHLLRQLRVARGRNDGGLSFDLLVGDLLAPWWQPIRRIARWRLHTLRPSQTDLDEIAAEVLERLGRAVERTSFSKPFKYVVADNIEWAALDYARTCKRRARDTPHDPTTEMPAGPSPVGGKRNAAGSLDPLPEYEGTGPSPNGLAAQARSFGLLIENLGPRDRRILSERFLAGTLPEHIAEMLGVERGTIDTATHRALRRLATDPRIAVRKTAPRSEGEAA